VFVLVPKPVLVLLLALVLVLALARVLTPFLVKNQYGCQCQYKYTSQCQC
jgi:hypothetical protein